MSKYLLRCKSCLFDEVKEIDCDSLEEARKLAGELTNPKSKFEMPICYDAEIIERK